MTDAKKSVIQPAIAALALLGPQQAVLADQQKQDASAFTLEKIIVSATRTETSVDEVSRSVSLVDAGDLNSLQAQSLAESIRMEPNLSVSGGPRDGGQSINIRGLEGNKVLQVVDGVRQVFESGHRPSYFLDPELLSSIEVLKGPVSSLWGSGAIGGVVAQNTISARDLLEGDSDFGGFVKSSFNANNEKKTFVSAIAGRTETLDWLLSGYFRDSDNLELGNGEALENSAKEDKGALVKADWQVSDSQALTLSYRQSNENGEIPSNGAADLSSSVFLIDRETDTQNVLLNYNLDTESSLLNADLSAYWNSVEMAESRVSDGRGDSTELDVFGISLKNRADVKGLSILYGLDGYREEFTASRAGANRPTPPEAETDVWGAFVNATIALADRIDAEAGLRYDKFETAAENLSSKSSDHDLSPSLALILDVSEQVTMVLRHDRAFRAPSSEELYTTGTHFCMGPGMCNVFVSNPDLKPEKAANTELMTRVVFEPNAAGGQLTFEGSVFENKVDQFIEQIVSFAPFPGTTTWVNVEQATIKGFELSSGYIHNDLSLKLAYGQSRGKDDNTGAFLSNIPADKTTVDLSYFWSGNNLTTGLRVSDVSAQNKTMNGEQYDAYTLADVYAGWSPSAIKGLEFDLSINNLSDRYYRQAWQQLYEPGREIILATKYSF